MLNSRKRAATVNASIRETTGSGNSRLSFPPKKNFAKILGAIEAVPDVYMGGGVRPTIAHLYERDVVMWDPVSLTRLSPAAIRRMARHVEKHPMAFSGRSSAVALHGMDRLVKGVKACIAWLRERVPKKYAVIVESNLRGTNALAKSSAWLASVAQKSLGPATAAVAVESRYVGMATHGTIVDHQLLVDGMDLAYGRGVRAFVHIDDFIGSGQQKAEMIDLLRPWLESHPRCSLFVCTAFAAAEGRRAVQRAASGLKNVHVKAIYAVKRASIFPHKIPNTHTLGRAARDILMRAANLSNAQPPYAAVRLYRPVQPS